MKTKKLTTVTLLRKTYLEFIKNSAGARSFQNLFAKVDDQERDVTEKGRLSCAYFVSAVLVIFGFAKRIHATIDKTLSDMIESGWYKIPKPRPGAVIHWGSCLPRWERKHLGFFLGDEKAVSNIDEKATPQLHDWTYEGRRPVLGIYWSDKIQEKLIF